MAFEPGVVRQAGRLLQQQKEERARRRSRLEQELYQRQPELKRLDRALRGTMIELAGLAAAGTPLAPDGPEVTQIREKNLALQRERERLLKELGHEARELEELPACPKCRDTGWAQGRMCSCLKQLCLQ